MALREVAPQVAIACDICGHELDFDCITLYCDNTPQAVREQLADYEWEDRDGRHVCASCIEQEEIEREQRECSHGGPRIGGLCQRCLAPVAPPSSPESDRGER